MSKLPPVVFEDDNPEWTAQDFARARPAGEVLPQHVAGALARKPGRPAGTIKTDAKRAVSLRLDPEVIADFRASGPGWQSRMNLMLRARAQIESLIRSNEEVLELLESGKMAVGDTEARIHDLRRKNTDMLTVLKRGLGVPNGL